MVSLYTADYVVTQNDTRDIHRNAAVAVEDGRILSVYGLYLADNQQQPI